MYVCMYVLIPLEEATCRQYVTVGFWLALRRSLAPSRGGASLARTVYYYYYYYYGLVCWTPAVVLADHMKRPIELLLGRELRSYVTRDVSTGTIDRRRMPNSRYESRQKTRGGYQSVADLGGVFIP